MNQKLVLLFEQTVNAGSPETVMQNIHALIDEAVKLDVEDKLNEAKFIEQVRTIICHLQQQGFLTEITDRILVIYNSEEEWCIPDIAAFFLGAIGEADRDLAQKRIIPSALDRLSSDLYDVDASRVFAPIGTAHLDLARNFVPLILAWLETNSVDPLKQESTFKSINAIRSAHPALKSYVPLH